MPTVQTNDIQLHYRDDGHGAETVLLCHGLLFSGRMFDEQVQALSGRYRCIRPDFRGQGQSPVTRSGYDMDTLTDDIIGLIEQLDCAPCHLVGFSMGGFVGLRVALKRPELLRSLVLMNTSAENEAAIRKPRFALLNFTARLFGLRPVAPRILDLLFSDNFIKDPKQAERRQHWMNHVLANDRIGATRAVSGVTSRTSLLDRITHIQLPTLLTSSLISRHSEPRRRSPARRASADIASLFQVSGTQRVTVSEAPEGLAPQCPWTAQARAQGRLARRAKSPGVEPSCVFSALDVDRATPRTLRDKLNVC